MSQQSSMGKIGNVTVERTGQDAVHIQWETDSLDRVVSIHMDESPTDMDTSDPVAVVKGQGHARISGLDPEARYYFRVMADGGKGIVAAERGVPFEGAVNFRDLGGYQTGDGRHVKWGQVFRSDTLARLTERDQILLKRMGIKVVCDLRTAPEVEKSPDRLPGDGTITHLHFPIAHGEFNFVTALERIKEGDDSWLTDDFMVKGYIENVERFGGTWGRIITRLMEAESRPLVFHCTGGKDRAGTCAAIVLLALGVPEEKVIQDHQLSNVFIGRLVKDIYRRLESYGVDPEKLKPYFTAPHECIVALIDHINSKYGSVSRYLATRAGVDKGELMTLQERLLDPSPTA
jgi:protein-tyrosine phosphatase